MDVIDFLLHLHYPLLFFFWSCHLAAGILIPPAGIKSGPSAVKAKSPNHWTSTEFTTLSISISTSHINWLQTGFGNPHLKQTRLLTPPTPSVFLLCTHSDTGMTSTSSSSVHSSAHSTGIHPGHTTSASLAKTTGVANVQIQRTLGSVCLESRSVMYDSLRPLGLHSPWNSSGQNTGVGSLSLPQGIFPTQVSRFAGGFFTC